MIITAWDIHCANRIRDSANMDDGYLEIVDMLLNDEIDHKWIDILPFNWRMLIKIHFGINYEPKSFEELAVIFRTDPEGVRIMQNKALGLLEDLLLSVDVRKKGLCYGKQIFKAKRSYLFSLR